MSRRRTTRQRPERGARPAGQGRRGAPGGTRSREPRRSAGGPLWIVGILAVLVTTGVGLWIARRMSQPVRPAAVAAPPTDALEAMPSWAAYDTALALSTRGENAASLLYFMRAQRGVSEDFWQLHYNYASALYNVTLGYQKRRGITQPRVRSTIERAALVSEAIRETEIARRLARAPHDRAVVIGLLGRVYHVSGFPWEAFVAYRDAQFADPADHSLAVRADRLQWSLEHPTAALLLPEEDAEATRPVER